MKTVLLLPCFLALSILAPAQIAYYAAKGINDNCVRKDTNRFSFKSDQASIEKLSAYLKDFIPDSLRDNALIGDQVFDHFTQNPFFGSQIRALSGASSGFLSGKVSSIASSLGGLDVTNIANGISQFMIERAKQELTIAFFNKFKKFADDNPEFQVLFPQTTDNLENLLSYEYPEMLPALRIGFYEDLKTITYHLDDVLELPRYHKLLKDMPEIRVTIRSIRLVHELESGESHIAAVLDSFANLKEWDDERGSKGFVNFGSTVKLASIFSQSLRDTVRVIVRDTVRDTVLVTVRDTAGDIVRVTVRDTIRVTIREAARTQNDNIWITFTQTKGMVRDDITFKIFLGLVYQMVQNENIKFYINGNEKLFTDIMREQKDNLFLFENKITEFIELANKIDRTMDTLGLMRKTQKSISASELYNYIDISLDLLEYSFSVGKLFAENLDVDDYSKIARKANDLYRNVYREEYTQVVSNAIDIIRNVNDLVEKRDQNNDYLMSNISDSLNLALGFLSDPKVKNLNEDDIRKIDKYIDKKSPTQNAIDTLDQIKSLSYLKQFNEKLMKYSQYGLFIANMAEAESAEEISSILENATLPVGSSSIKKNSNFNISIQSYLGAYYRIAPLSTDYDNGWSSDVGVIAPIGFAFSWGIPPKWGSASLFVPLLDLGAIVDYKLTTETVTTPEGMDTMVVQKDYKIELGQIFSPGCYFVYGFPWSLPISFGIGGQYGPGLNKVSQDNSTIVNDPQWRWNAFLAVDIPLFNLTNVPRNKARKK